MMSIPGPSEIPPRNPVTLGDLLIAQLGGKSQPFLGGAIAKSAVNPSRAWRAIALIAITLTLSLSAFAIYRQSINSVSSLLLALGGIVDAGLYVFGFLSAYAYEQGLSKVESCSIKWLELVPGVIYFGLAWAIVSTLHVACTGFSAIVLFWAFGS